MIHDCLAFVNFLFRDCPLPSIKARQNINCIGPKLLDRATALRHEQRFHTKHRTSLHNPQVIFRVQTQLKNWIAIKCVHTQ